MGGYRRPVLAYVNFMAKDGKLTLVRTAYRIFANQRSSRWR